MSSDSEVTAAAITATEEWVRDFTITTRWLLPKSAAGSSASPTTNATRVAATLNALLELAATEPDPKVVRLARAHSAGPIGSPTEPCGVEAAMGLVLAMLWFSHLTIRDREAPVRLVRVPDHWGLDELRLDGAQGVADEIRSGIQKHVTHDLVAKVRAHALAELASIPISTKARGITQAPPASDVAASLKPAERAWVVALGELLNFGKTEIGHQAIANHLDIDVSTSQGMPSRLRKHDLIPKDPPKTKGSSFSLTALGWQVFGLLTSQT